MRIRILNKLMRICDLCSWICSWILTLMRIRIQLFSLQMRIQIQLPKILRIASAWLIFKKDFNSDVGIPIKLSKKWINQLNCVKVTSCVINYLLLGAQCQWEFSLWDLLQDDANCANLSGKECQKLFLLQLFIHYFYYSSRTTCCCTVSQGFSARIVASFSTTKNTCSGQPSCLFLVAAFLCWVTLMSASLPRTTFTMFSVLFRVESGFRHNFCIKFIFEGIAALYSRIFTRASPDIRSGLVPLLYNWSPSEKQMLLLVMCVYQLLKMLGQDRVCYVLVQKESSSIRPWFWKRHIFTSWSLEGLATKWDMGGSVEGWVAKQRDGWPTRGMDG